MRERISGVIWALEGDIVTLESALRHIRFALEGYKATGGSQTMNINSLGELQALGPRIDAHCGTLNALFGVLDSINKQVAG